MPKSPKKLCNSFLYQYLVATTGMPDHPFTGGSQRPKNLENPQKKREKKLDFHTLIHTFAHTLHSAPKAMLPNRPNRLSATCLAS